MKKLKLNIDDLKIDSFKISSLYDKTKGTVVGNLQPVTDTSPNCTMLCSIFFNDCGNGTAPTKCPGIEYSC